MCVSSYAKKIRLNAWDSGQIMISSLPAIPTLGLSLDDLPQLMERCQALMHECIGQLDLQLATA
ncbi:hypothetical protein D3C84_940110 [compost metagenome]